MYKPIFKAPRLDEAPHVLVFCARNAPVQRRARHARVGRVLRHHAHVGVGQVLKDPAEDFHALLRVPGQNQVPHEQAAPHQALFVKHCFAHLRVHGQQGALGHLRIVRAVGERRGGFAAQIFEIRQVYVHQPVQRGDLRLALIARAVPHHGHGQAWPQRFRHGGQEMPRRDQVDVVYALSDQTFVYGAQIAHGLARSLKGQLLILAIHAAQRATGEKHRA